MKAVILAGGLGTRISEETIIKPKPMVEIGSQPILWHIMKMYSHYGINDFIICLGYKGYLIKEYFSNYFLHTSDVTFDIRNNEMKVHRNASEAWNVTLIDTGEHSMTGGRLKRVEKYVEGETFCFTYGDGLSDVNIAELIAFHQKNNRKATVTTVRPPGRFGVIELENDRVSGFREKHEGDSTWINGGFFVLGPEVFKYIDNDACIWENGPIESLAAEKQLSAYLHDGFWQPMDTLRDKMKLEELWTTDKAPWKVWS
ncbi:glucose-1-phosphate cytidylyltransferase [Paenibacillus sp. L3-i20]|uniref:glucose-1-phosphate cytidylyltransferase n=1 Tax=Paenibacillus sp. L3-i20 TaxID=2905833 RepID=UPI001EDD865F|nr:glucose-1-phosphate cytidylyltransferase [Paenibacillus sp. L3-i20]GKU76798.1 glucose-1-phosphate cytidylyltransferase [Paenibacillus sp. L3-i20]